MNQRLVGIYHLLQIEGFVAVVRKGSILVELLIECGYVINRTLRLDDLCNKDATGKVTTVRDEVDGDSRLLLLRDGRGEERGIGWFYLVQTLTNLVQVLMGELLIDAEVRLHHRE